LRALGVRAYRQAEQSIRSNCFNIGDLSERYGRFCKLLLRSPNERFAELFAGKICTGLFKCALNSDKHIFGHLQPKPPMTFSIPTSDITGPDLGGGRLL
jgi:hypothetical protein